MQVLCDLQVLFLIFNCQTPDLYRNSNHFYIPRSAELVFLQLKLPHYFITKLFQLPHHISQHHDKFVKDIPVAQIG